MNYIKGLLSSGTTRKRFILLSSVTALLVCCLILAGWHTHTPGEPATCTEAQICTQCGKEIQEAYGHRPGAEATCDQAQVCEVCGEVITPALGHTVIEATCTEGAYCSACGEILSRPLGHTVDAETGLCTVCGEKIMEPGCEYITPGAHGEDSADVDELVSETESTGHYNSIETPYWSSNVIVCGDYAYEPLILSDETQLGSDDYAAIINEFAEKYSSLNITAMIAPKAAAYETPEVDASILVDPYDSVCSTINNTYGKLNASVNTADVLSVMDQHRGEYMFYRTDINWTGLGAYYAYTAYCEANGMQANELDSYETVTHTGYRGSLYNFSNEDSRLESNLDYTTMHFPQHGYTMQYTYDGETWYNGKAIDEGTEDDPNYTYNGTYLDGGVHPLIVIHSDNKNGKVLLMVKDPYGNALAPYLIDNYETIVLVDYTYDQVESTESLIEEYGVTDVLILSNVQAAVTTTQQERLSNILMK